MDTRAKTILSALVAAGVIGYWLFAGDPPSVTPESRTAGQTNSVPARRIPGLPYPPSTADRTYQTRDSVFPGTGEPRNITSNPVQGYHFRPLDGSTRKKERYLPYNRPFSDYDAQPDFGATYGLAQQPSYAPVETPGYPAYRFRPLEEEQQTRRQQGNFRQMTAPPASLAGPGSGVRHNPHPT